MTRLARFEKSVLPHLDAAYNLARWLTRNDHDAEDVVQEAFLRAFRFHDGMHGNDARPWLLAIVRNTGYSWLEKNRPSELVALDDAGLVSSEVTPVLYAISVKMRPVNSLMASRRPRPGPKDSSA